MNLSYRCCVYQFAETCFCSHLWPLCIQFAPPPPSATFLPPPYLSLAFFYFAADVGGAPSISSANKAVAAAVRPGGARGEACSGGSAKEEARDPMLALSIGGSERTRDEDFWETSGCGKGPPAAAAAASCGGILLPEVCSSREAGAAATAVSGPAQGIVV